MISQGVAGCQSILNTYNFLPVAGFDQQSFRRKCWNLFDYNENEREGEGEGEGEVGVQMFLMTAVGDELNFYKMRAPVSVLNRLMGQQHVYGSTPPTKKFKAVLNQSSNSKFNRKIELKHYTVLMYMHLCDHKERPRLIKMLDIIHRVIDAKVYRQVHNNYHSDSFRLVSVPDILVQHSSSSSDVDSDDEGEGKDNDNDTTPA
jgi:hypothetical protein